MSASSDDGVLAFETHMNRFWRLLESFLEHGDNIGKAAVAVAPGMDPQIRKFVSGQIQAYCGDIEDLREWIGLIDADLARMRRNIQEQIAALEKRMEEAEHGS